MGAANAPAITHFNRRRDDSSDSLVSQTDRSNRNVNDFTQLGVEILDPFAHR